MVKVHQDLYNLLHMAGVWRADITESNVGTMVIIVIPPTCPHKARLEELLFMSMPAYVQTIVTTKEQNWLKHRKKHVYRWRIV